MARKKEIHKDPRVEAMATCMLFALRAFRNKPVFDQATKNMEGWHQWFKRVLTEAGYKLVEPE